MEGYKTYKKIPNRLRERRLELGLNQRQVAYILGLKDATKVSRWETGSSLPSLVNAFKLGGIFGRMTEHLFEDQMRKAWQEVKPRANEVLNEIERNDQSNPSTPYR